MKWVLLSSLWTEEETEAQMDCGLTSPSKPVAGPIFESSAILLLNSPTTLCQSSGLLPSPHPLCLYAATGTAKSPPPLARGKPRSPLLFRMHPPRFHPGTSLYSSCRQSSRKPQALLIPDPLETTVPTSSSFKVTASGWHSRTRCYYF